MMAVNGNDTGLPDPSPGPTDDGYIAVAVKSVPQDPFCCDGPERQEDGVSQQLPALKLLISPGPFDGLPVSLSIDITQKSAGARIEDGLIEFSM